MMTTDKDMQSDIEALLPWHAAGTLNRRDAQRVEEALAHDPELARRFALVREELGEAIVLNETLGAPSAKALDVLFAKIDAEPARRTVTSPGFGARIGEFFASLSPRTLAFAGGAAAFALLLQAGIIANVMLKENNAAGFQTASTSTTEPAAGAFALIRFAPQATQDEVTRFLDANKMSIVGGPSAGGLYKVKIAPAALSADDLAATIKKLQDNTIIGFIATTP